MDNSAKRLKRRIISTLLATVDTRHACTNTHGTAARAYLPAGTHRFTWRTRIAQRNRSRGRRVWQSATDNHTNANTPTNTCPALQTRFTQTRALPITDCICLHAYTNTHTLLYICLPAHSDTSMCTRPPHALANRTPPVSAPAHAHSHMPMLSYVCNRPSCCSLQSLHTFEPRTFVFTTPHCHARTFAHAHETTHGGAPTCTSPQGFLSLPLARMHTCTEFAHSHLANPRTPLRYGGT